MGAKVHTGVSIRLKENNYVAQVAVKFQNKLVIIKFKSFTLPPSTLLIIAVGTKFLLTIWSLEVKYT